MSECDSADDKTCSTGLYEDMVAIQSGEQLVHTITTKTSGKKYYALSLEFLNLDAEQSQIGTDGNPLYFSGYVTLESTGEVYIPLFSTDSWATIASNIQSGNASRYKVGEEKEVEMDIDDDGIAESYTVRVANNSTPTECSTEGFSQTACGFVVEFVDIIEQRAMNSTYTNVGGWPSTKMRTYLNGDTSEHLTYNGTNATLYSKLPSDLRNAIIDTRVVSGHGSTSGETNFTSTDKIYLLSTAEIWANGASWDTAKDSTITRQLDYYLKEGVTISKYGAEIKYYAGSAAMWWLRAADSTSTNNFLGVYSEGLLSSNHADNTSGGLAPAFRIG